LIAQIQKKKTKHLHYLSTKRAMRQEKKNVRYTANAAKEETF